MPNTIFYSKIKVQMEQTRLNEHIIFGGYSFQLCIQYNVIIADNRYVNFKLLKIIYKGFGGNTDFIL